MLRRRGGSRHRPVMSPLSCKLELDGNIAAKKATASSENDSRSFPFIGTAGRRGYILSMTIGLATGMAIMPIASDRIYAVLITFGAFCISAATAHHALWAERRVEDLEQKL